MLHAATVVVVPLFVAAVIVLWATAGLLPITRSTSSSNPKIDDIKATWQNGDRNIEKSDFYSEDSRIQYHFDSPVVNKLWIEHEDYTISIQNMKTK